MAKVKVRILYPSATQAAGIKGDGGDVVEIESSQAEGWLKVGFVEEVKTETAAAEPSKARTRKKTTA
jgi:hypothetical protein